MVFCEFCRRADVDNVVKPVGKYLGKTAETSRHSHRIRDLFAMQKQNRRQMADGGSEVLSNLALDVELQRLDLLEQTCVAQGIQCRGWHRFVDIEQRNRLTLHGSTAKRKVCNVDVVGSHR